MDIPVFDTTAIHTRKAAELAMEETGSLRRQRIEYYEAVLQKADKEGWSV